MKIQAVSVILILLFASLAVGCVFVYCNKSGDYDASATLESDGMISYSLSGDTMSYRYSVFSDTSLPEKIYFYLDERYPSVINDHSSQSEFFSVIEKMLERRGFSSVKYTDADGLRNVMDGTKNAVFFVSGTLPDTVIDNGSFQKWMENGGTVYWTGPEIGRYVSTLNGVTDRGTGYFGGNVNIDSGVSYAYTESNMMPYTQMRYDECLYGLSTNQPDSVCLSYTSDNGYSSVSVARLFNGNVFVFGGNIASVYKTSQVLSDRISCADLIICGLTYQSKGIDHGEGSVKGIITARTTVDTSPYIGRMFFISAGPAASNWSESIYIG